MIDLILFTSSVGLMRFICRQDSFASHEPPTPSSPTAVGAGGHHESSEHFQFDNYSISNSSKASATSLLQITSRLIFQTTLLLSLWLFCLSILEAAPASWLLAIHETSSFVQCYRIILWSLCILLEVAIPMFLGVLLVVKFSGHESISMSHEHSASDSSLASSPSKTTKSPTHQSGRRDKNRLLLVLQVIWISVRFIFVAALYILRRFYNIFLPSSSLCNRHKNSITINNKENIGRNGELCTESKRARRYCSAKVVLPVICALSISFYALGKLSTIVISSNSNALDSNEGNIEHKSTSEIYFHWIFGPHSPLKSMVKKSCALGIMIASVLNGFGCASLPHSNLVGMYLKPTTPAVLAKIEEDYFYAIKSLEEKKFILFGLLRLSANACDDNLKIKMLREEISFLENLIGDMCDDIDEMKHSQKLALKARTTVGRISWILGLVFSIILVVRVALAASSFISALGAKTSSDMSSTQRQRRDPITMALLWLTGHHIVNDEQYNLYVQGTSLILAGFLTMSQVRYFFRVVGYLGRKLSHLFGVSIDATNPQADHKKTMSDLSLLMASFVMGCYFLSCVVVIKMTLPIEYQSTFSAALGKFDFGFNATVLNMVFCASTCTSAIILGFLFGIQRNNSERYNVETTLSTKGSFSEGAATHTA